MTKDRRSFLKQSSGMMAGGVFNARQGSAPDTPFVHHVLFWLKDKRNSESYGRLVAALKQLRKVEAVRFLEDFGPSTGILSKVVIYDSLRIAIDRRCVSLQ